MKNFVVIKKIPIFGGIYVIEDKKTRRREDKFIYDLLFTIYNLFEHLNILSFISTRMR